MSLEQASAVVDHSSSKSPPPRARKRFTIDSILETTTSTAPRRATVDDRCATSVGVPSDVDDCIASSLTDRDHSVNGDVFPRQPSGGGTGRRRSDDERCSREMTLDRATEDGEMEERDDQRGAIDVERERPCGSGGSGAQCSSLLARTAVEFQRRHQRRVAQLRSFGELFLAQYEQYQRQLRNHFRHQSAQRPSNTVDALRGPSAARCSLPDLDGYRQRRPPDGVRSPPQILHNHRRQSPTSVVQSRTANSTSGIVNWSAVDRQPLPLPQPRRFVDGSAVRHATFPPTVDELTCVSETRDQFNVVDYSCDRNTTKWTTADIIGIRNCSYCLRLCIRIQNIKTFKYLYHVYTAFQQ